MMSINDGAKHLAKYTFLFTTLVNMVITNIHKRALQYNEVFHFSVTDYVKSSIIHHTHIHTFMFNTYSFITTVLTLISTINHKKKQLIIDNLHNF